MDSEDYQNYRERQQQRRAERLPVRQGEIEALGSSFKVVKLTPYQYRINDVLDLYPIHNRYHALKPNKRGGYKSATEFVNNFFK
jgi:hypothetical protein